MSEGSSNSTGSGSDDRAKKRGRDEPASSNKTKKRSKLLDPTTSCSAPTAPTPSSSNVGSGNGQQANDGVKTNSSGNSGGSNSGGSNSSATEEVKLSPQTLAALEDDNKTFNCKTFAVVPVAQQAYSYHDNIPVVNLKNEANRKWLCYVQAFNCNPQHFRIAIYDTLSVCIGTVDQITCMLDGRWKLDLTKLKKSINERYDPTRPLTLLQIQISIKSKPQHVQCLYFYRARARGHKDKVHGNSVGRNLFPLPPATIRKDLSDKNNQQDSIRNVLQQVTQKNTEQVASPYTPSIAIPQPRPASTGYPSPIQSPTNSNVFASSFLNSSVGFYTPQTLQQLSQNERDKLQHQLEQDVRAQQIKIEQQRLELQRLMPALTQAPRTPTNVNNARPVANNRPISSEETVRQLQQLIQLQQEISQNLPSQQSNFQNFSYPFNNIPGNMPPNRSRFNRK